MAATAHDVWISRCALAKGAAKVLSILNNTVATGMRACLWFAHDRLLTDTQSALAGIEGSHEVVLAFLDVLNRGFASVQQFLGGILQFRCALSHELLTFLGSVSENISCALTGAGSVKHANRDSGAYANA
jgi:hypothetical protein